MIVEKTRDCIARFDHEKLEMLKDIELEEKRLSVVYNILFRKSFCTGSSKNDITLQRSAEQALLSQALFGK